MDVFADLAGQVVAAVPRSRLRVDSGVSVAGATFHDEELEQAARRVATAIGLTTVANVQLRRDREGRAALLEVNPRFPGAMPLTIAAGVDMPSLTLDAVLGRPTPAALDFRDIAVVRYLEDVFLQMSDILRRAEFAGELGPRGDRGGPGMTVPHGQAWQAIIMCIRRSPMMPTAPWPRTWRLPERSVSPNSVLSITYARRRPGCRNSVARPQRCDLSAERHHHPHWGRGEDARRDGPTGSAIGAAYRFGPGRTALIGC